MNIDEIKYSLQNLVTRKTRSSLSILSILIGIASIFALLSFGFGIQSYVDQIATEAGTDKLFIQAKGIGAPGTDDTFALSKDDVNFVSKIKGVKEIEGILFSVVEIEFKDVKKFHYALGFDPKATDFVEETFTFEIGKGRGLKEGDLNKVVLGYNYQVADRIFKRPLILGDKINLQGESFSVIGFYEEVGNPSDDANVYLTDDAYVKLFPDKKDKFAYIMARADKGVDATALAERITDKLRRHKDQDKGKEDFFVQSFEDALATFGTVVAVLNGVLFLIAAISMLVATVNIMNTMYTSVLERTKEIGIMKAVGAKNSEILFIFIFEAGVLGFVGGILGILIGYLISSVGGGIAAAAGYSALQPVFPLSLIIGSLLFATIVATVSGVLPSIQAAKLKPVDALRYE